MYSAIVYRADGQDAIDAHKKCPLWRPKEKTTYFTKYYCVTTECIAYSIVHPHQKTVKASAHTGKCDGNRYYGNSGPAAQDQEHSYRPPAADPSRMATGVEVENMLVKEIVYGGENPRLQDCMLVVEQQHIAQKLCKKAGVTWQPGMVVILIDMATVAGRAEELGMGPKGNAHIQSGKADVLQRMLQESHDMTGRDFAVFGRRPLPGVDVKPNALYKGYQLTLLAAGTQIPDLAKLHAVKESYQKICNQRVMAKINRNGAEEMFVGGHNFNHSNKQQMMEGYAEVTNLPAVDSVAYEYAVNAQKDVAELIWDIAVKAFPVLEDMKEQFFTETAKAFLYGNTGTGQFSLTVNKGVDVHRDSEDSPLAIVGWYIRGDYGTIYDGAFVLPTIYIKTIPLNFTLTVVATRAIPHGTTKPTATGVVKRYGSSHFAKLSVLKYSTTVAHGFAQLGKEEAGAALREHVRPCSGGKRALLPKDGEQLLGPLRLAAADVGGPKALTALEAQRMINRYAPPPKIAGKLGAKEQKEAAAAKDWLYTVRSKLYELYKGCAPASTNPEAVGLEVEGSGLGLWFVP